MATPLNVVIRLRGGRANPSHPEGAQLYNGKGVIYVIDKQGEMWVIFSPHQIHGWYPGAATSVYVLQGGNEYHCTIRGVVDVVSGTTSGNVPNVPCRSTQYVRVHS